MSDFDKYIRQGDPDNKERAQTWQIAIGLQDVDGLKPSEYLLQTASRHSNHELIRQTLDYDFGQEKKVDYPSLDANQALKHLCKFVADIWQIHPFGEGNTCTTAVFTMKYLHTFRFTFDNSVFQEHSWYFRNLLFGEKDELHNRTMHIAASQSANANDSKSQNDTLN